LEFLAENLDTINKIILLITSLCFLTGIIWAFFSFKYKFDTDLRNLYIKNCEKVLSGLRQIGRDAYISNETLSLFASARQEAEIYLHREIFNFVDDLYSKSIKLNYYNRKLEKLDVGEERSKICAKEAEILDYFTDKLRDIRSFYRKFLINEINFYDKYIPTFKKFSLLLVKKINAFLILDIFK